MWISEMTSLIIISCVYGIVIFCTVKIRQTLQENAKRRQKKESKSLFLACELFYAFVFRDSDPSYPIYDPSSKVLTHAFQNLQLLGRQSFYFFCITRYFGHFGVICEHEHKISGSLDDFEPVSLMKECKRTFLKLLVPGNQSNWNHLHCDAVSTSFVEKIDAG
jgi:hypothetical protein